MLQHALAAEEYFQDILSDMTHSRRARVYLLSSSLPLNKSVHQTLILPISGFRLKCSMVHLSFATGPSMAHVALTSSILMLKYPVVIESCIKWYNRIIRLTKTSALFASFEKFWLNAQKHALSTLGGKKQSDNCTWLLYLELIYISCEMTRYFVIVTRAM